MLVKAVILNAKIEEKYAKYNYGLQLTIQILVYEKFENEQWVPFHDVVQKVIHEPLWYSRRYRLQIFHSKEKKVVPMKQQFDILQTLEFEKRLYDTQRLASLALGFIDYSTGTIIPVTSGRTFHAFRMPYRGTTVISRYVYQGERGDEIFPDDFTVGYDTQEIERYLIC